MQRRHVEHTHECCRCHVEFRCGGTLERNFDGYPEVICRQFHEHGIDWCIDCQERTYDDEAQPSPDGVR